MSEVPFYPIQLHRMTMPTNSKLEIELPFFVMFWSTHSKDVDWVLSDIHFLQVPLKTIPCLMEKTNLIPEQKLFATDHA